MPFIAHEKLSGVEVKIDFPDGDKDFTPYHAYVSLDDTNDTHLEVEELPGGNTEFRIVKKNQIIWKHEIPYYVLPEEAIMYAVGLRAGIYDAGIIVCL